MEFRLSREDEAFREELRAFLARELPPDWEGGDEYETEEGWAVTRHMRKRLAAMGWLTMAWPKEYGGQAASHTRQMVLNEEMAYRRAPGRDIWGVRMLAPTLMIHGSEAQRQEFLPPVARGEVQWCQGYSEPGSGSDLASLQTRAVQDGDDFVVNGSKIWTSAGHRGDHMFLLVRTDPDAPKHRGISFLLVDMRTPGISIRPIINMAGKHHFNQVFFDNLRVPKRNLVGELNRGWYVAVTLLDFERSGVEYSAISRRYLEEMVSYARDTRGPDGQPLSANARIRSMLVDRWLEVQTSRLIAYRVGWMQGNGIVPNKEASMSKVFGTETEQRVAATGLELLGLPGVLWHHERGAPLGGRLSEFWAGAFSATIAGGTSEIQRNIIANRGLGLPRG